MSRLVKWSCDKCHKEVSAPSDAKADWVPSDFWEVKARLGPVMRGGLPKAERSIRNNGFAVKEADGTPSSIIRFGPEMGVGIALRAIARHLSKPEDRA